MKSFYICATKYLNINKQLINRNSMSTCRCGLCGFLYLKTFKIMEYTTEYFIANFEKIPNELWNTGRLTHKEIPNCHCALGHCGMTELTIEGMTEMAKSLSMLLKPVHEKVVNCKGDELDFVYDINDNANSLGSTPKERILTALNMVKSWSQSQ